MGHHTVIESAQAFIDSENKKGRTTREIRADDRWFQEQVFRMKVELEDSIPPKQHTFFDRGLPDTTSYCRAERTILKIPPEVMSKRSYREIFLMERLPFKKDYARTEDAAFAEKITELLFEDYSTLGYDVVRVPVVSIEARINFILRHIHTSWAKDFLKRLDDLNHSTAES